MVARSNDALSEVIGFVLIIALIAIIASLYLTYVVPSQGRDLEIAHMDVIQNQFYDYKTTVDSLWLNGQYNTQVSSPFTLGTNPGNTQGSFINLPLFQPVTSGGTLLVTTNDNLVVTADSRYGNESLGVNAPITNIVSEPDHLYVSVKTDNINQPGYVRIQPNPLTNGNWEVNLSTSSSGILSMTILKNNNPTISNVVIKNSLVNGTYYPVDLADNIYGLKGSFKYPFNLNIINGSPVFSQQTGYNAISNPNIISTNMGSLEYHSNNNYWISQNYVYQFGGVFLMQDNGAVVKLLPSITITQDNADPNLARVTINNLSIPQAIPSRVGGSSLVQAITMLQKPAYNPTIITPARGIANSRYVTITINARDEATARMWRDTFTKIKQQSNVPDTWIEIPVISPSNPRVTTMTIYGNYDKMDTTRYDVILDTQSNIADIYLSPTSY